MDRVPIQDAKIARVPWEYYTKGISDYYTNGILEYYTKGISDYYTKGISDYYTKEISRSRSRKKVNELAPEPCPSQFGTNLAPNGSP